MLAYLVESIILEESLESRVCDISDLCFEFHFEVSAVFIDELDII